MRIMIVEDNQEKIRRLVEHLVGVCELVRDRDILIAQCGLEARALLKTEAIDLLILDIVLPMRPEDEPASKTALNLLFEITERTTLKKPGHIVGLTAFGEAANEVEPQFSSRLWTVIFYDQSSEEWLRRIEGCIEYMRRKSEELSPPKYNLDLCIVTALENPEAKALHRLPWNWKPSKPIDDNLFAKWGSFASNGEKFTVASITAPRMGMVATALVAAKAVERLRPRFLAMTGICAGIRGKTNIGDVILADPSWDYQSGKRTRDKENSQFSIDPHHIPLANYLKARAEQFRTDNGFWTKCREDWIGSPETGIKLLVGPLASGSAVLADGQVVSEIKEQQRKLLGIEMEVYGLYAAAVNAGFPRPTAIAFKGVCDFADDSKNDAFQDYAAYTSAKALGEFFERYMSEVVRLAGS